MTPFVLLTLWSTIGLFLAVRMAMPGEARSAWAPAAVILGPLWATIDFDRQEIAEDLRSQRMR